MIHNKGNLKLQITLHFIQNVCQMSSASSVSILSAGLLVCWSAGLLVCWSAGLLVC
jgi:hypothetical protein